MTDMNFRAVTITGILAAHLALFTGLMVVGCDQTPPSAETPLRKPVPVKLSDAPTFGRFAVESHGKFNAGFDNNMREILVLRDTETSNEYLGITGVGVTELRVKKDSDGHKTTKEE